MNKKAIAAMSGGVDSTVAAYLAKKQGYDCIGVTMKLFDNEVIGVSRSKTCCSADDAEDARSAAYKLGIPFYVFNFKGDFEDKVIKRFVSAYENGHTPNPCIDCNRCLKFETLYLIGQLQKDRRSFCMTVTLLSAAELLCSKRSSGYNIRCSFYYLPEFTPPPRKAGRFKMAIAILKQRIV